MSPVFCTRFVISVNKSLDRQIHQTGYICKQRSILFARNGMITLTFKKEERFQDLWPLKARSRMMELELNATLHLKRDKSKAIFVVMHNPRLRDESVTHASPL